MRHWKKVAVLVMVMGIGTSGCQLIDRWRGRGGTTAGPFAVKVVDASTGLGVEGAMVTWETYFEPTETEPEALGDRGAETTGPSGMLIIPAVTRSGGGFRELQLRVTGPLYQDALHRVEYNGGDVVVTITPAVVIAP